MNDIFTQIYETNGWKNDESVSGRGSNMEQTETIRQALPLLFSEFHVKTVLDIPCGDFYWLSQVKEIEKLRYIGADIVTELIHQNRKKYPSLEFEVWDAIKDTLPKVDLILCRDMLGHLDNASVKAALKNFRASGSTYLLATTFPDRENIPEINTGEWRPINLASMFGLPNPILVINEKCTEGNMKYTDKSLGLWRLR